MRIWDAETGAVKSVLAAESDGDYSVALSRDGKTIVSGSIDKTVRIWNAETGAVRSVLEGH